LTLVESIIENPERILRCRLDKIKGDAVAEMKAAGLDYEERLEKLENLEYPKPQRDIMRLPGVAGDASRPALIPE
jgi:hypothetical protein